MIGAITSAIAAQKADPAISWWLELILIVIGALIATSLASFSVRSWRWIRRPKLEVRITNSDGDSYGLKGGGNAKYIHVQVGCNTSVQCRARAVGLKEEDGETIAGFSPISLVWHGEHTYGEIEPDIPAKLNLVCAESTEPHITKLCVPQGMSERGHVTRVSAGNYVLIVRFSSQYGDHMDKKFRFYAPNDWDDLHAELV